MKKLIATGPGAFILVVAFTWYFSAFPFYRGPHDGGRQALYARTLPVEHAAETQQAIPESFQETDRSRPRTSFVKLADFQLRNDEVVFGKLITEDKNKIIVERVGDSKIVVSTYSKREIDVRTLRIKSVPEAKYYIQLGEYFYGRTWDFTDDPDDFIQAIRCYEKARQLLTESQGSDSDKLDQIDHQIKQVQADRDVWTREVRSRTKLRKLEFEAEIEKRLKDLDEKVNTSSQQIDEIVATMKERYGAFEQIVADSNKDLLLQFEMLADRVRANARLLEDLLYPRYYRHY